MRASNRPDRSSGTRRRSADRRVAVFGVLCALSGTVAAQATFTGDVVQSPAGALGLLPNGAGVGNLPLGVGTVTVGPGGALRVDYFRPSTAVDSLPFLAIGEGTGTGTLNVAGGSVRVAGDTGVLNVGRFGGVGTLNITAGGTVAGDTTTNGLSFATVGRAGTGTLNVSGAGSQLTLSGIGGVNTQGLTGFAGSLQVGRSGPGLAGAPGDGTATVTAGGRILIDDGGAAAPVGPALTVGFGTGTTGRLTIDGAGSRVDVVGASGSGATRALIGAAIDPSLTSSPGGGTGIANLSNGAQLNVTAPFGARIEVGSGRDANGVRGNGTLSATSGASITTNRFNVGAAGGVGTATFDAAALTLGGSGAGSAVPTIGGTLFVGNGGGTGTMALLNGSTVTFSGTTPVSGILLGGTPGQPAGVGTLRVDGGSSIDFAPGTSQSFIEVGNSAGGIGRLEVTGGSSIDLQADGRVIVARDPLSAGRLVLDGASTLDAGALFGLCHDGAANTDGLGTARVTGGSTLSATTVRVGRGCTLSGSGTIVGSTIVSGGFINPGDSPGRMVFDGGFDFESGRILLEVASNGLGGWLTDTLVFTDPSRVDLRGLDVGFAFLGDADPLLFRASGLWSLDTFFRRTSLSGDVAFAPNADFAALFAGSTFGASSERFDVAAFGFDPVRGVTDLAVVPVPGSMALIGAALLAWAVGARRVRPTRRA